MASKPTNESVLLRTWKPVASDLGKVRAAANSRGSDGTAPTRLLNRLGGHLRTAIRTTQDTEPEGTELRRSVDALARHDLLTPYGVSESLRFVSGVLNQLDLGLAPQGVSAAD